MAADNSSLKQIPVGAPIDTDSAGKGAPIALRSVIRILCPKEDSAGTGFVHKSGRVITAEHVVHSCSEIVLLPPTGQRVGASIVTRDAELDLAVLSPAANLSLPGLTITSRTDFAIGTQVTTWGFPGGYTARVPLLAVGYLSGMEETKLQSGRVARQWVVNAAFNRGNSGGPLLQIETGEVIGVVSSKLAPISPTVKSAMDALANQQSGFSYSATLPDGSTRRFSEAQVVGMVLEELRNQVQLVIGKAVLAEDLRKLLKDHGIEP